MTSGSGNLLEGRRITVVSNEQPGTRMAGPAIRATNLARELARAGADVVLACPQTPDTDLGVVTEPFGKPDPRGFRRLARSCDIVLSQPQRVDVAAGLHRGAARVVYDCYVPSFVEYPASMIAQDLGTRTRDKLVERNQMEYAAAIDCGDAFVVASDRQRDFLLGALGQAGRLQRPPAVNQYAYPSVAVVPFGLPDTPAEPGCPGPIKGVLVPDDAVVALWAGGVWNWFDPLTVVRAVARARRHAPQLHLVFLASGHPSDAFQGQGVAESILASAEVSELLESGAVVFAEEWVPYHSRGAYLRDADLGVCAFFDSPETHMSFRTRFLDHLWAGLPTVTTAGGVLSDAICGEGAGVAIPDQDVVAWAAALTRLAGDSVEREAMSGAALAMSRRFTWSAVSEPLVELLSDVITGGVGRRRRPGPARVASYLAVALENRLR